MAATCNTNASGSGKGGKAKSNEAIFAGFQNLRAEQRQLASKISELETDLTEHKIVMETLRGVEGGRRCFRMVGGVLVEQTVGDVLPELESNVERLPKALEALNEQLAKKGEELNKYIETHDIRIQRNDMAPASGPVAPADSRQTNVLVPTA